MNFILEMRKPKQSPRLQSPESKWHGQNWASILSVHTTDLYTASVLPLLATQLVNEVIGTENSRLPGPTWHVPNLYSMQLPEHHHWPWNPTSTSTWQNTHIHRASCSVSHYTVNLKSITCRSLQCQGTGHRARLLWLRNPCPLPTPGLSVPPAEAMVIQRP